MNLKSELLKLDSKKNPSSLDHPPLSDLHKLRTTLLEEPTLASDNSLLPAPVHKTLVTSMLPTTVTDLLEPLPVESSEPPT